jgi:REP element-mobilizing transposase RayT
MVKINFLQDNNKPYYLKVGWQASRLPHLDILNHYVFITSTCDNEIILSDMDKDIVFNSIIYHDKNMYELHAAVVMDTHFHIIINPLESLSKIMHSIKSYSSHEINKLNKKTGIIWKKEYFDRVIRSDEDYIKKINYIINNPIKVNLNNYKWLYVIYGDGR